MKILALDLATKTGYYDGETADVVEFRKDKRAVEFYAWLEFMLRQGKFDAVVFENAFRQPGKAAEIFQQFKTVCILVCTKFGVKLEYENPTTIKKSFTGSGKATKEEIIKKVLDMGVKLPYTVPTRGKNRGERVYDDNAADAVAIYETYNKRVKDDD